MDNKKQLRAQSATTQRALQHEPTGARWAALAATVGFGILAVFQFALAMGAPLGGAAWGGQYAQLPTGLRIGSAVSVTIWAFATWIVLRRAGFRVAPLPTAFVSWSTWFLAGALPLAALLNFASSSVWERFVWGPTSLILAVLCFILARSGSAIRE
jgi:hypothetical protein